MDWRKSATAASNSILDVAQDGGKDAPTDLGVFPVRLVLIDSGSSQAKWKPGVKGCKGIEFVKVQECKEGVEVRCPGVRCPSEAKFKHKPGVQVEAKSKRKSDVRVRPKPSGSQISKRKPSSSRSQMSK